MGGLAGLKNYLTSNPKMVLLGYSERDVGGFIGEKEWSLYHRFTSRGGAVHRQELEGAKKDKRNISVLSVRPRNVSRCMLSGGNSDRFWSEAMKPGRDILFRPFAAPKSLWRRVTPSQCELGKEALA
jgi:hypothetical protein